MADRVRGLPNTADTPCRLRDRGNLTSKCGQSAQAVDFLAGLDAQDTFREGLKQLDMARCLVELDSRVEARHCVENGRLILSEFPYLSLQTRIENFDQAIS